MKTVFLVIEQNKTGSTKHHLFNDDVIASLFVAQQCADHDIHVENIQGWLCDELRRSDRDRISAVDPDGDTVFTIIKKFMV